jgi:flap endonuclease-1
MKLIEQHAPEAITKRSISYYNGKTIAIDASHFLYQYTIAIRNNGSDLLDRSGNVVSHLHAIFYRTIAFLELGIKPIYVFDGTPPDLKRRVLQDRKKSKRKSEKQMGDMTYSEVHSNNNDSAFETCDKDREYIKHFKRCVYITKKQIDECQELLKLMGVPFVQAIGEADAQCASMARCPKCEVWAVSTEDMDILTFNSPFLLRNMSTSKRANIIEISLDIILLKLGLSYEQFIDLCILMGCDYCPTVKGIGFNSALPEIKKHKSLDALVANIKNTPDSAPTLKYRLPEHFEETSKMATNYFLKPDIIDPKDLDLRMKKPKKIRLTEFLCKDHSFDRRVIANKIKMLCDTFDNK